MADVKIRNLDDSVVATYRARASHAGRSLEEELRIVLTDVAFAKRRALADHLAEFQEKLRREYGEFPDSTPLIRAERDERG